LEIENVGVGEAFLFRSSLSGTKERNHSVLVRDQWVGANQNPFDPAHDGGAGADSKRETEDCQDRESGIADKHSHAEANILQKFVGPSPHPLVARDFFGLLDSAKLAQGRVARFLGRHSRGNVSFDQKIDMHLHLFRHLRIATALLK
jgi:hypothetical protein